MRKLGRYLAPASLSAALAAAAMLNSLGPVSADPARSPAGFVVMVEFAVEAERSEQVVSTVRGLLDRIVRTQDGFHFARIHREANGGKVVNYMQWQNRAAFDKFRGVHKDEVGAAIGKFGPKFSFFEIAHVTEAAK
jgi:quinol monooxygenase YgiN